MFSFRPAQASDALNLAALSVQVWLHTYAKAGLRGPLSRYIFREFTEERFATEIRDTTKRLIVCEADSCLVGYVKIARDAICPVRKIKSAEIETLYVQEHFAGQGIGSALLESAMEYCRANARHHMFLLVNLENSHARKFYEGQRFEPVGTAHFALEDERHANAVLVKNM